ncbi:MAG: hypothetical protein KIT23_02145 [Sphingopyxis sp.]|nr:hypothetical protein [Sphingopyxis sp.]
MEQKARWRLPTAVEGDDAGEVSGAERRRLRRRRRGAGLNRRFRPQVADAAAVEAEDGDRQAMPASIAMPRRAPPDHCPIDEQVGGAGRSSARRAALAGIADAGMFGVARAGEDGVRSIRGWRAQPKKGVPAIAPGASAGV